MRTFLLRRFVSLAIAIVLSRILFWAHPALSNDRLLTSLWIAFIIFAAYQIACSKALTLRNALSAALQFANGVVAALGLALLAMSFLLPRLASIVFGDASFEALMPNTHTIPWLKIFLMALCIGVTEEAALRGYLQDLFIGLQMPLWLILIIQGLLFAAPHTEFFKAAPGSILYFSLVGMFFSIVVFYFQNLYWAIGFHFCWDFTQTIFFGSRTIGTGRYLTETTPTFGTVSYMAIVVSIVMAISIIYLYWKLKAKKAAASALPK